MSWARRYVVRDYVTSSLWVLPLLAAVLGPGLATLDVHYLEARVSLPADWAYSPGSATSVLTAIVGAMVGLLGFVVTIGVLVVTTATGSLSPRFMRLWYRDRMQRIVLATFVLTFTFAFALLRRVRDDQVPDLGVSIAGLLVTVSVVLLLIYLNRFIHRLRPVAVAALVAQVVHRIRPAGVEPATESATAPDGPLAPGGPPALQVSATGAGAIQAVAFGRLVRLAHRRDLVVVLDRAVGDFVTAGTPLMRVYGADPPAADRLRNLVALGKERAVRQDPAFALRIMVDIAIRALSPAVNDPTTAVQVIDHIDYFLQTVARVTGPYPPVLPGPDGRVRVLPRGHTWAQYLRLACTEIRVYGARSPQPCRRLRAALTDLRARVAPWQVPAVDRELARLTVSVAATVADPAERAYSMAADRQGIGGPGPVAGSGPPDDPGPASSTPDDATPPAGDL